MCHDLELNPGIKELNLDTFLEVQNGVVGTVYISGWVGYIIFMGHGKLYVGVCNVSCITFSYVAMIEIQV